MLSFIKMSKNLMKGIPLNCYIITDDHFDILLFMPVMILNIVLLMHFCWKPNPHMQVIIYS